MLILYQSLQNSDKTHIICFTHPICDILLEQPYHINEYQASWNVQIEKMTNEEIQTTDTVLTLGYWVTEYSHTSKNSRVEKTQFIK